MALAGLMAFFLVLVRVGCIFAFLPFLGSGKAPKVLKALIVLVLSLVIFPVSGVEVPPGDWSALRFSRYVAAEALLGCLMGVAAYVVFASIRIAGELVGRQIGMALAITADPVSGVQATPLGNFAELVGILVLFSIGGHHLMLAALHRSFALWPLGSFLSADFIRKVIVTAGSRCFLIALQVAAPLLLITFMVSLVMAVMARLVPEVNILVVGFPLRIGVGLIGLTLFVPTLVRCSADVSRAMVRFITGIAAGG